MVLDFANDAEAIREAFAPYYEPTILSESTDPNLLDDLDNRISQANLDPSPPRLLFQFDPVH